MVFENRSDAADRLAERLAHYRGQHPVVLAIPRGAVPMARVVADALDGDLDVVLVRKLAAPFNPELAVGSIDETGAVYLDPEMRHLWTEPYLEAEKARQMAVLQARRRQYAPGGPPVDVAGRVAIVLDDGMATGSTMVAALRAVRTRRPSVLIAAAGVAAPDALRLMRSEADEVVCVETPPVLYAVGDHFRDFLQVPDEEVVAALRSGRRTAPP